MGTLSKMHPSKNGWALENYILKFLQKIFERTENGPSFVFLEVFISCFKLYTNGELVQRGFKLSSIDKFIAFACLKIAT